MRPAFSIRKELQEGEDPKLAAGRRIDLHGRSRPCVFARDGCRPAANPGRRSQPGPEDGARKAADAEVDQPVAAGSDDGRRDGREHQARRQELDDLVDLGNADIEEGSAADNKRRNEARQLFADVVVLYKKQHQLMEKADAVAPSKQEAAQEGDRQVQPRAGGDLPRDSRRFRS